MDTLTHQRLVPAPDVDADRSEGPDGPRITLTVAKYGPAGTRLLRLFGLRTTARLRLDRISSATWVLLDGRTVAEVLAALQGAFPDEEGLSRRLGTFLSGLVDRGWLREADI